MATLGLASLEGTFEFIEAKIRRDADGTLFASDFEWLCKWFLENAPTYRGQFERVWLWKDWPDRWGTDAGIDIVALTRTGELWAIQAKADHPTRAIPKREIDSFLSESNRVEFAYRLLMATTDEIGATARRTLRGQEKPVGLVLRGHFLTERVLWPVAIGEKAPKLKRWKPRAHQAAAIKDVISGFKRHDRGRLIMACGTGKTLTSLWIAERLRSSLTLALVPSLSLVQQNITEWGRHSKHDFDRLVVCSDETVASRNDDAVFQSTTDLGVKVTTDRAEIRRFLSQRRKRPAVVFATYQSSDRIAAAQTGRVKPFDLVVCDEAHRLAGHSGGLFATVLDGRKIKARRRLFMTATPRYFKEHVKRRATELEFELVSMDDEHVFGREFHVLTFYEAISATPPLLTDYQVVVMGVSSYEAKVWVDEARLVRAADGLQTDARTLAAQIGIAKAMKKYDLRKIITFHSSVAKAERFVDASQRDSLPRVIPRLSRSSRPSGRLWAKHISGSTPAGKRATLLKGLGNLSNGTRGILSNCACLSEGVDVPVLDGVAFVDPKRTMVGIIQAVGRVIRKAEGKQIGTVVIPVFIDETEDADKALSQSAFEPVWQVLKALRAHDERLAEELDQLRVSLGGRRKSIDRGRLPDKVCFDIPRLLLRDFEQAFYVRTVERTTDKPPLTIDQILTWADDRKAATGDWPGQKSGQVTNSEETWRGIDHALRRGQRGLPSGSSLARLLAEKRGVRNASGLPPLTIEQVLAWADAHRAETGGWPNQYSGTVTGTNETWRSIQHALLTGGRSLPGGSSISKVLTEHRGVRNTGNLPSLSIDQILEWADVHQAATGKWPNKQFGGVAGTDETWLGIDTALHRGKRGLPKRGSLAKLLADYRAVRNTKGLAPLTIEQILDWADTHKAATGSWPRIKSGRIAGTDETWSIVDDALIAGRRGLPAGSSLAKLLTEQRGVRNSKRLPRLEIEQILTWADAYNAATGEFPRRDSGEIAGTDESWAGINASLMAGRRGLPGKSSLAKLLYEHRGVRNVRDLPPLTVSQILTWADAYKTATGEWPNSKSGTVRGTAETWSGIQSAVAQGNRGLPRSSSLTKLLAEHRLIRNPKDLPPLNVDQILQWADQHYAETSHWPTRESGQIRGTDERWAAVDSALLAGSRGLVRGSSLPRLLAKYRGVPNKKGLPPLSLLQILDWADAHKAATGNWPNAKAGRVKGTDETWQKIATALQQGQRGFPGGSSLAKLLAKHRSVRNQKSLPLLSIAKILKWADAHKLETGNWPRATSGLVNGTDETWQNVNAALKKGIRGLPGDNSLAKLLAERRGVRNKLDLPPLTINQILAWADAHMAATGEWPNQYSGEVSGTDETWAGLQDALLRGRRGLRPGSSLARLLSAR